VLDSWLFRQSVTFFVLVEFHKFDASRHFFEVQDCFKAVFDRSESCIDISSCQNFLMDNVHLAPFSRQTRLPLAAGVVAQMYSYFSASQKR